MDEQEEIVEMVADWDIGVAGPGPST